MTGMNLEGSALDGVEGPQWMEAWRSLILRAWTMSKNILLCSWILMFLFLLHILLYAANSFYTGSMRMISSSMTGEADQKSKYCIENIAGYKHLSVIRYVEEERYLMGFIFFTGVNFILTMVADVLCVCFTLIKGRLMLVLDLFISIMTKLILVKVHNWKALLQCNKICRSREKRIKQTTKKGKRERDIHIYIYKFKWQIAGHWYFGQYGKVLKVSISRTAAGAIQHFANNTCNVDITYSKEEEAVRCIQSVHGFTLDGGSLRACFGTTKYCHAWLRNVV
ncbi:General negative regulator of transcription subunit 4 [Camellia lanceoleosa]|uniref:General negative regulator of transcription subunit 4 n=1 Tax=Camellia lanceoleosa TaxID=1840588 RepID=A0ACC0IGY5_9ERIC|nr:General negative regulator of transcription subunit 4 [Camellia lanceoleosa]